MSRKPYTTGRTFIGRIPTGEDIVTAITRVANDESIRVGSVTIQGSVSHGVITRLDHQTRLAQTVERDTGMEIASMTGTISMFKGRAMARLAAVLVSSDGSTLAGTIALGTTAWGCEAIIVEHIGATLSRDFDEETGLPMWKEASEL